MSYNNTEFGFKEAAIQVHEIAAQLHRMATDTYEDGVQTNAGYHAQQPSHDATALAISLTQAYLGFNGYENYNYVNDNLNGAEEANKQSEEGPSQEESIAGHETAASFHECAIECLENAAPWN